MTQAAISSSIFSDVAFLGIRASIGIIFLLHGLSKLGNEMYIGWMSSLGISPEFATIIAIGEIVPGILLFVGVLSRLSAGVLADVMNHLGYDTYRHGVATATAILSVQDLGSAIFIRKRSWNILVWTREIQKRQIV